MSSSSGRAGAYRVREQHNNMSIVQQPPRSAYQKQSSSVTNRPKSVYANYSGSSQQPVRQYPKSVITFEFYDPPPGAPNNMADPNPHHQLVASPQRRPLRVTAPSAPRGSSPKPATRHQVAVKKLGGGGAKIVSQQRTSSASPTTLGHYQSNTGYFTITAYLPFDGGKRLKLQCTPGMTVQQVIETEIPDISRTGYQVYHFPSRALLNPEKDASVLQDQEICIEPMRLHNKGEVNDKRLAIVKELLRTEDMYLESLRNIFDVYMEPLRKWSLPQTDMNVMFRSLSRLCDLLMNFFSELEIVVGIWDTRRTLIGGLFRQYPSFWDLYEEYGVNYPRAIRLLKEKCRDDAFTRFLAMKRGAARHTLESLMLLPVQRIYEYHRLLVQLFTITSKDHPDYDDLRHTVARVQHMVQSREHQLTQSENESKLDQVQSRFPNDTLYLSESLEAMEALTRRSKTSSPAGVGRGQQKKSMNGLEQAEMVDSGRKGGRAYIQEGPAKFLSGVQSHDRYLFLFDDILLVAKPTGRQRSQQRTFRLKHRVRLSELWLLEVVEPLLVAPLSPELCLVFGWPVANNFVVQFSSVEEKELWSGLLEKCCGAQMKSLQPDSLPITIINHTKSSNQMSDQMMVHCTEKVDDVLARALDKRGTPVVPGSCHLLVKYAKDESAVVLLGYEHPYSIQAHQNRQTEAGGYAVGESKPPGGVEFYIKRKNPPPPVESKAYNRENGKAKKRSSKIKDWYRGKRSRDGPMKKRKFRLFGAPLSHVIVNGQLPDIIQEMLVRLYNEGPETRGIFRITANTRKVKEMKETINNRQRVDLSSEETSIHTVAALLKDLLRNVPGGILLSSRYTEFVATNDFKDVDARVQHIQRILQRLPPENLQFLHYLLPLLHRITEEDETNGMNAINLAICFAPTLLWPDSGLDVIKNEVPPLIQFMIQNSPRIFGTEVLDLYGMQTVLSSPSPRSYRVPTKKTDGNLRSFGHGRNQSFDTSTSEDSAGEDDLPSNLVQMQSAGLTVSDSQVSVLSQQLEEEEEYAGSSSTPGKVLVLLSGERHHHERFPNLPKRPKKSRPAERSSSYRGPNERPLYVQKYHAKLDDASRRKSIATQTTLSRGEQLRYPSSPPSGASGAPSILQTPSGALSSPSQEMAAASFFKSRQMQSFDENEEYEDDDIVEEAVRRRPGQKMKHGGASPYRHYSVDHILQGPALSDPHSVSYYDHLPPLSSGEPGLGQQRRQPRKLNLLGSQHRDDSFETPMDEEEEDTQWDSGLQILSSAELSIPTVHASNQSITSRSSGSSGGHYYSSASNPKLPQSRPSNTSLVSSVSESSYASASTLNKESPEPERTSLSREMVITRRFHIPPSRESSFNSVHTSASRSDSFNQEMENIQRKFQERRRPEALHSVSTASSTTPHSEIEVLSSPQSFDDDRPESERHLHSLPRRPIVPDFVQSPPPVQPAAPPPVVQPATGIYRRARSSAAVTGRRRDSGTETDPNRLSVDNNNSDTESSPSRTLTRRDRLVEWTTNLRGLSTTLRYQGVRENVMRPQGSVGQAMLGTPGRKISHPSAAAAEVSIIPAVREEEKSGASVATGASAKAALTQSLPSSQQPALTATLELTEEAPALVIRPKSAEGSTKVESGEGELRKRAMSNVENAKVKLGLIPPFRRSRSISDSKSGEPLAGEDEEEEEREDVREVSQGNVPEKNKQGKPHEEKVTEKVDKRGMWRAHAPNSTDRKEAYTQRMKAGGGAGTRNTIIGQRGVSTTNTSSHHPPPPPAIQRTATAPEMGAKRRATTMPEYLAMRSSVIGRQGRVLGHGLVRTVKITSYNIPEPKMIHRINVRTFH